jgi:F-type H+-transporting ATPase subunit alpha
MKPEYIVCVIYAGVRGYLDKVETKKIGQFESAFIDHLNNAHPEVLAEIRKTGVLSKDTDAKLGSVITQWLPTSGLL